MILEEYLIWYFHSQAFSRTVIEFFHHRLDLLIRDAVELSFFREVLSDESIGVFIRDEFSGELIRVPTSACFLPLFAGLAGNEQVLKMVSTLENWMDQKFLLVPSTAPHDPSYEPKRYWRGPVWPHINWMI